MNRPFAQSLYDNQALWSQGLCDISTGVADTPAATVSLVDIGARRRYGHDAVGSCSRTQPQISDSWHMHASPTFLRSATLLIVIKRRLLSTSSEKKSDLTRRSAETAGPSTSLSEHRISYRLEMWANAQRDGRPAEYRWRPLFNAAKFV